MGQFKITFRASGTFTVPIGVTSVTVECEGAGGGGGNGSALFRGGGGGGGAYASSVLSVTPGDAHSIVVGVGGPSVTSGGLSSFGTGPLVRAAGGTNGTTATGVGAGQGGAGGTVANSIGTTRTAGTNGLNGAGGGAGAPPLGGAGGTNTPGVAPGGGGGGGAVLSGAGLAGAGGIVIVTFDYADEAASAGDTVNVVVDWHRAATETLSATDDFVNSLFKPQVESVTVADNIVKNIVKPYSESLTATDAFVKAISLLNQESVVTSDTINKILSTLKVDSLTASEAMSKLTNKPQSDSISTSDSISKSINMPVAEGLSVNDFAFVVLVYLRYYDDIATATDAISKGLSLSKQDSAVAVETVMKLVIKKFPDESVSVMDSAFVQAIYNRLVSDSTTATDALYKMVSLGFADNISGSAPPPSTGGRRIFIISD